MKYEVKAVCDRATKRYCDQVAIHRHQKWALNLGLVVPSARGANHHVASNCYHVFTHKPNV